jgi:hypothetical protein
MCLPQRSSKLVNGEKEKIKAWSSRDADQMKKGKGVVRGSGVSRAVDCP